MNFLFKIDEFMLFCKWGWGQVQYPLLKIGETHTSSYRLQIKLRSAVVLEQLTDSKVRKLGAFSANFGICVLYYQTEFDL